MNIQRNSRIVVTLAIAAGTAAACSSSSKPSTSPTSVAAPANASTKADFCSAEVTINKAGSNVSSAQDFLNVLKANGPAISTLDKDAPVGKIGTEAKALVSAANSALASNNPDALNNVPRSYSGDIDSYCGVDGNGDPLPSYFAQGKGSQFCDVDSQLNAGAGNAESPSDLLAFLKSHQDLVSQAAASMSSLPSPVQSETQTLITAVQRAIATNNADLLNGQDVQNGVTASSLYCGEDQ